MKKYKVNKCNNLEATRIKMKYLDYFKKLSREFIEIEEERRLERDGKMVG